MGLGGEVRRRVRRAAGQAAVVLEPHVELGVHERAVDLDGVGRVDRDYDVLVDVVVGPRRHPDDVLFCHLLASRWF